MPGWPAGRANIAGKSPSNRSATRAGPGVSELHWRLTKLGRVVPPFAWMGDTDPAATRRRYLRAVPHEPSAGDFALEWAEHMRNGAEGELLLRLAFEHWHASVFATAYRITGSRWEAEDITQGTFETLLLKLRTLRDPARVPGFLRRCTVRAAISLLKRNRWRRYKDAELLATMTETSSSQEHTAVAVRHILDCLDAEQRAAVVLRFVEGRTFDEIAGLMGVSVSTIQRRIRESRRCVEAMESDPTRDLTLAVFEGDA